MPHGNAFRNHLVKADVHRVRVGKRYQCFTFSDQWGPHLTDEWGEPVSNVQLADEDHPFWPKFEAWLNERDARDPDPSRKGIFRDHNCWKCGDGARPCANGLPNRCEYPHARND